jgi:hypothetical protein
VQTWKLDRTGVAALFIVVALAVLIGVLDATGTFDSEHHGLCGCKSMRLSSAGSSGSSARQNSCDEGARFCAPLTDKATFRVRQAGVPSLPALLLGSGPRERGMMRRLLAASVVVTVALVALSALGAGAAPETTATTTAQAVAGGADASGATSSLPTYQQFRQVDRCGTPGAIRIGYPGLPCAVPFGPNLLVAEPFLFAVWSTEPKLPYRKPWKTPAGKVWVQLVPSAGTQHAVGIAFGNLGGIYEFVSGGHVIPWLFTGKMSRVYLLEPNARAARNLIASVCHDGCHKPIPRPAQNELSATGRAESKQPDAAVNGGSSMTGAEHLQLVAKRLRADGSEVAGSPFTAVPLQPGGNGGGG